MSIHIVNIDNALNKIKLNQNEFIYGGITKDTVEECLDQYIKQ